METYRGSWFCQRMRTLAREDQIARLEGRGRPERRYSVLSSDEADAMRQAFEEHEDSPPPRRMAVRELPAVMERTGGSQFKPLYVMLRGSPRTLQRILSIGGEFTLAPRTPKKNNEKKERKGLYTPD